MSELPTPDVVELDLEDIYLNLERLRSIGENPKVKRTDELNAALSALPIMHKFVVVLKNFEGETSSLPEFESAINKVNVFNEIISNCIIAEAYSDI